MSGVAAPIITFHSVDEWTRLVNETKLPIQDQAVAKEIMRFSKLSLGSDELRQDVDDLLDLHRLADLIDRLGRTVVDSVEYGELYEVKTAVNCLDQRLKLRSNPKMTAEAKAYFELQLGRSEQYLTFATEIAEMFYQFQELSWEGQGNLIYTCETLLSTLQEIITSSDLSSPELLALKTDSKPRLEMLIRMSKEAIRNEVEAVLIGYTTEMHVDPARLRAYCNESDVPAIRDYLQESISSCCSQHTVSATLRDLFSNMIYA